MTPENWMRIPQWLDAKRLELEKGFNQWLDLNDLIRDVLVAEHQGIDTADDLPDQEVALRMLLSEELRLQCLGAQGKADSDFYKQVSPRPITEIDRSARTYLTSLSHYVTEFQKLQAIRRLAPK